VRPNPDPPVTAVALRAQGKAVTGAIRPLLPKEVPTVSLQHRISHYEALGDGRGGLGATDWLVLVVTGILLPGLCLLAGWLIGW
jgi:hypothetical protein